MSYDIKTRAQGLDPNARPRNVNELADKSSNIYESLVVISTRARQISTQIKRELQTKLEEFSIVTETIEEMTENKEQIEISKFYEKLPSPVVIATDEFMTGELSFRQRDMGAEKPQED